jgi:hypothetical protein
MFAGRYNNFSCPGSSGRSKPLGDGGAFFVKRRCRFSSCFFFFANAF